MKLIERKEYLKKLNNFKDKHLIKVITGIRRCGKSTLLELFQERLKKEGVEESQIIKINFENPEFKDLKISNTLDGLFIKENVDLYITG